MNWMFTLAIVISMGFTLLNVVCLLAIQLYDKRMMNEKIEMLDLLTQGLSSKYMLLDCMQCVKGTSYDKPGVNWKGEPVNE